MAVNPFDMMIQTFLKSAGIEPGMAKARFEQAVNLIAGFDKRLSNIESTQREILFTLQRMERPAITVQPSNGVDSHDGQDAGRS